jgi:hypothetical protein
LNIIIPVDLDTLPIMLKLNTKFDSDLNDIGHPKKSVHLYKLKAVMFDGYQQIAIKLD